MGYSGRGFKARSNGIRAGRKLSRLSLKREIRKRRQEKGQARPVERVEHLQPAEKASGNNGKGYGMKKNQVKRGARNEKGEKKGCLASLKRKRDEVPG